MDEISVLICDDSALMRNLIGRIVDETEGMKIQFKRLAFYHFFIGHIADVNGGKIRLSGNGTQTGKFRTVEFYKVVVFGMFVLEKFQYLWTIIGWVLGVFIS